MQQKKQKKSSLSSRSIKENLMPNQPNKTILVNNSKCSLPTNRQADQAYQKCQKNQRDPSFLKKPTMPGYNNHSLAINSNTSNNNSRTHLCTNLSQNLNPSEKIPKQLTCYSNKRNQLQNYDNVNVKSFFNNKKKSKRDLNKSKSQSRSTIQINLRDSDLIKTKVSQQDHYVNSQQLNNQQTVSIQEQHFIKGDINQFVQRQQLFNMMKIKSKAFRQIVDSKEENWIGNRKEIIGMMIQQIIQRRISKLQLIEELDLIQCKILEIQEKYQQLSTDWDQLLNQTQIMGKQQQKLKELERQLSILNRKAQQSKDNLYLANKDYLNQRSMREYTSQGQKDTLLFEAESLHNQLKSKLHQSKFQEIVGFNLKVLLPSRARSISPISISNSNHSKGIHVQSKQNIQQLTNKYQINQFSITQNNISLSQVCSSKNLASSKRRDPFFFENKTDRQANQVKAVFMMYQQLFHQKAAKKFALIVKKNNLGPSQAKYINQFLKRIVQLENCFTKMDNFKTSCPQSFQLYVGELQRLTQQIDQLNSLIQVLQKNQQQIQERFNKSKVYCEGYQQKLSAYLRSMDENIKKEYAEQNQWVLGVKINVNFIQMLRKKYLNDFEEYKLLRKKKIQLKSSHQKNQRQLLKLLKYLNQ